MLVRWLYELAKSSFNYLNFHCFRKSSLQSGVGIVQYSAPSRFGCKSWCGLGAHLVLCRATANKEQNRQQRAAQTRREQAVGEEKPCKHLANFNFNKSCNVVDSKQYVCAGSLLAE